MQRRIRAVQGLQSKDGDVIGVMSFKVRGAEGMNFAVSASQIPLSKNEGYDYFKAKPDDNPDKQLFREFHKESNSLTPLHRAVGPTDLPLIKKLIAQGAEVNAKTALGHTPLWYSAVVAHSLDTAKILIGAGANVNAADRYGCTLLNEELFLFSDRQAEWVSLLIAHGADVNTRDKWGGTPLSKALNTKNDAVVRILKEHGAK